MPSRGKAETTRSSYLLHQCIVAGDAQEGSERQLVMVGFLCALLCIVQNLVNTACTKIRTDVQITPSESNSQVQLPDTTIWQLPDTQFHLCLLNLFISVHISDSRKLCPSLLWYALFWVQMQQIICQQPLRTSTHWPTVRQSIHPNFLSLTQILQLPPSLYY